MKNTLSVLLLGAMLLCACSAPAPASAPRAPAPPPNAGVVSSDAAAPAPVTAEQSRAQATNSGVAATGQQQAELRRMVIQNVQMTLAVDSVDQAVERALQIAGDAKGYVQSSNVTRGNGDDARSGNMVLRLPAGELDKAIKQLRALAAEVRDERVTGQDVTAEFADLDIQVKNLEAAETQLRTLMAKMEKPEDVLRVFNEITRIRGEIERMKGRMNQLSTNVALATVTLSFVPVTGPSTINPVRGINLSREVNDAWVSLQNGLAGIARAAIWFFISVLPQMLLVLLPIWLIIQVLRRVFRAIRKPSTKIKTPTPPPAA